MEKTIAQEALEILEPIPAGKWTTDEFQDSLGRCCALGHLEKYYTGDPDGLSFKAGTILKPARDFLESKNIAYAGITLVNDSPRINGYTEDNPKDRVIHLLKDMIEAGY